MKQLVVLAILATMMTVAFAWADPLGLADRSTASMSWLNGTAISLETFALLAPGIAIAFLLQRHAAGTGQFIGALACFALPILMLINAVTWRWIGDGFFSASLWRAATELRESLWEHMTVNVALAMGYLLLAVIVMVAVLGFASRWIADYWEARPRWPGPGTVFIGLVLMASFTSLYCLLHLRQVRTDMWQTPFQHPWCVMHIASVTNRHGDEDLPTASRPRPEIPLATAALARQQRQRQVAIRPITPQQTAALPDILVVIVESFRRELVDPEVMPNLAQYARQGLHCRSHFSGGNATNHGVFSLVNGLEAIWHEAPVRYSPLMNRLLHEAGYQLGFFGSHNDWRTFQMDGYISPEQYDYFDVNAPGGMDRDRQAIQDASSYLQRRSADAAQRPPRLAVVYLYATHAPYRSYVDDQIFQPAADDRFLIPYTEASRDAVWNRYRNSAHSVDRLLKSLLRDDNVVIVTGDHGESFLDDGTIGHGIRLSEFQNMTPAILYAPGMQPRIIDEPTTHADLLPTLLGILGLELNDDQVFDGIDLLAASDSTLGNRTFVTRNYLTDTIAVISSHLANGSGSDNDGGNSNDNRDEKVFAATGTASLRWFHAQPLSLIDARGNPLAGDATPALDHWLQTRFGIQTSPR